MPKTICPICGNDKVSLNSMCFTCLLKVEEAQNRKEKEMGNNVYDKLPINQKLSYWQGEISEWHLRDEALISEGDILDLQRVLRDAREAIEKGDEAAIRLGELNIIRGIPDGITQTPNSTKETYNEPDTKI